MIHFVSGEYPPDVGGVGDYTANLRAALAKQGCESTLVTRRDVGRWNARGVLEVVRSSPKHGIVHIQYQAGAFDLLGDICLLPLVLRRFRPHVQTVTTFHDVRVPYLFPRAGRLRPAALRLLARTSHAVIAAEARDLCAVGRAEFQIPIGSNVPNAPPEGYDRQAFRASLGLQPDELAIVYFGLLNASKGIDLVLATVRHLPRARLLLLGGEIGASDPTDRTTAACLRHDIESLGARVIRTGWLASRDLSAYLLAGDVALVPYVDGASARRGSLLACAEHGLPIVSSQPATPEIAPFIAASEPDAPALASMVLRVAANVEPIKAATRALAAQVAWPRIADAHIRVYNVLA